MTAYRRNRVQNGCYFFTVNLVDRTSHLLIDHVDTLRSAFAETRRRHHFAIDAIVVLPDHIHAVWTLPEGDDDFSLRWRLIKSNFSRVLPIGEPVSRSRQQKGERGIWQRRFWEHTIRDDRDYERHIDYIHFNPVKHGYVQRPVDWPYSSFSRMVAEGIYPEDWGGVSPQINDTFGERR